MNRSFDKMQFLDGPVCRNFARVYLAENLKFFGRGDLFSNRYRIIFPVKSVIFEAHSFVNIEQIKQTAALMSTT